MSRAGQTGEQPAYVIHRRPYRETSLLVDIFSLDHGRLTVIARGANGPRSKSKALLQPFTPLLLDWQGRSELRTLTRTESAASPFPLRGPALYSGFYLNELIQRLLPQEEPNPEVFGTYIQALGNLVASDDLEQHLRQFERVLLMALGYGFQWDWCVDTQEPVVAEGHYNFDPAAGVCRNRGSQVRLSDIPGGALLALAREDFSPGPWRKPIKRIMRVTIGHLLQGRPLRSRELFLAGGTPGL